jgi:hypothetical protein
VLPETREQLPKYYLDQSRLFKLLSQVNLVMYLKYHLMLSSYVEGAMKFNPCRLFPFRKIDQKENEVLEDIRNDGRILFCKIRNMFQ